MGAREQPRLSWFDCGIWGEQKEKEGIGKEKKISSKWCWRGSTEEKEKSCRSQIQCSMYLRKCVSFFFFFSFVFSKFVSVAWISLVDFPTIFSRESTSSLPFALLGKRVCLWRKAFSAWESDSFLQEQTAVSRRLKTFWEEAAYLQMYPDTGIFLIWSLAWVTCEKFVGICWVSLQHCVAFKMQHMSVEYYHHKIFTNWELFHSTLFKLIPFILLTLLDINISWTVMELNPLNACQKLM